MFNQRKIFKKGKCVKKGECDKGEHFDNKLNKCVNDICKRTNEYYSQKNKKCIRKSTCKINQIFNKKCKAVLEYYSQHKQKCEKKPVCKSGKNSMKILKNVKLEVIVKLLNITVKKTKNV